jgi:hypothetical protein
VKSKVKFTQFHPKSDLNNCVDDSVCLSVSRGKLRPSSLICGFLTYKNEGKRVLDDVGQDKAGGSTKGKGACGKAMWDRTENWGKRVGQDIVWVGLDRDGGWGNLQEDRMQGDAKI